MHSLLTDEQFLDLYNYLASDAVFGPAPGQGKVNCDHTLRYTVGWMKKQAIQDIKDNVEKIMDLGGHCDCEVLYNVDPDTWEERKEEAITGPEHLGEQEWEEFVADVLHDSNY